MATRDPCLSTALHPRTSMDGVWRTLKHCFLSDNLRTPSTQSPTLYMIYMFQFFSGKKGRTCFTAKALEAFLMTVLPASLPQPESPTISLNNTPRKLEMFQLVPFDSPALLVV